MTPRTSTLLAHLDLLHHTLASLATPAPRSSSLTHATRAGDRAFGDETQARIAFKGVLDLANDLTEDDGAAVEKTVHAALGDGDVSLRDQLATHRDEIVKALGAHPQLEALLDLCLSTLGKGDIVVTRKGGAITARALGLGLDESPRPIAFRAPIARSLAPAAALAGTASPVDAFARVLGAAASFPRSKDLAAAIPATVGDWVAHGTTEVADALYARALETTPRAAVRGNDFGLVAAVIFIVAAIVAIIGGAIAGSAAPGSPLNVFGTVLEWIGIIAIAVITIAACAAGSCVIVAAAGSVAIAIPVSTCGVLCGP